MIKNSRLKAILLGAALLAGMAFLAAIAPPLPDGLESTAEEKGFLNSGRVFLSAALAEYSFPGVKDERLSAALSCVTGSLIVFFLSLGAGYLMKKRKSGHPGGAS